MTDIIARPKLEVLEDRWVASASPAALAAPSATSAPALVSSADNTNSSPSNSTTANTNPNMTAAALNPASSSSSNNNNTTSLNNPANNNSVTSNPATNSNTNLTSAAASADNNNALIGQLVTANVATSSVQVGPSARGEIASNSPSAAIGNTINTGTTVLPIATPTSVTDQAFADFALAAHGTVSQTNPYLALTGGGGDEIDYSVPWYLPVG